ncbi:hypothetical protein Pme01_34490 [Planosporangium mesophilum]|uniref:CHAT domain-containing protein n=2 Tax=Planosporangium mesophilum TaxID=689768 RepID=A0A8J3TDG6_9ACTN|nr:hypothetical protein Pme01_34490 [Planosporangium mesophilum]
MDALTAQRPDVTVYTTHDTRGPVLELTAPLVAEPLSVRLKRPDVVRERYARLGRGIAAATSMIGGGRQRIELATAGQVLADIAEAGQVFLGYALRDPLADVNNLASFLRAACPTWRNGQARVPLIHAVAEPDDYFPWELLPLFEPSATVEVRDQPGLEDAARVFPGFATVVERSTPDRVPDGLLLNGWNRLPVRVIYDANLDGAHAEVGFFRGRGRLFRLEGPYPRDVTDTGAPTLAQQLCDPALGVDGARRSYADQIVHFACHCEADGGDTATFAYRLADERRRGLVILLDKLVGELVRRSPAGRRADKPLVFLNACGTAVMDPASAASLLKPFHDNRNRGIIGTAANVPDRVAAEISKHFYTNLTGRAQTVGEALHGAKWRLLEDRGNPLGLLYGIHAAASIRVAPITTLQGVR